MVKQPKEFWTYYRDKIYNQDFNHTAISNAINNLIYTGLVKTVINLNYDDNINKVLSKDKNVDIIELKGNYHTVRCMSCNNEYEIADINNDKYIYNIFNSEDIIKCSCGGKIAPTITMFKEKYKTSLITKIKDAIFKTDENNKVDLNTHTLIFIGVDFEEDYMHELIESYNAIKLNTTQENSYCVMICEKDGVSIDYYQPEFATYEDIAGSINRLIDKLKESGE